MESANPTEQYIKNRCQKIHWFKIPQTPFSGKAYRNNIDKKNEWKIKMACAATAAVPINHQKMGAFHNLFCASFIVPCI